MSTIRRNGPAVWIYRCRENGPAGKVSRRGVLVLPDDAELFADGADSTTCSSAGYRRVRRGSPICERRDKVRAGRPAEIIGDNPFSLVGGTGAIWIRANGRPGQVILKAVHPYLGTQHAQIEIKAAPEEAV